VAQRAEKGDDASILAGVARSLPALVASYRLTQKAAGVGFDWPDTGSVFAKLEEEKGELERAVSSGEPSAIEAEVGDLLFTAANLARKLNVDPEAALALSNRKFVRRFHSVEADLRALDERLGDVPLERLDRLWNEAKAKEAQLAVGAQPNSERK
jgi:uncharacterized protein YabN with tetrapyrrole methylase and pyrophosphatase domain